MIAMLLIPVLAQAAAVEARGATDILVSLVEASRAGEAGAGTRVTLTLDGGTQLSGVVGDLSGTGVVLVDGEVLHVIDPRAVIAVSLPSASRALAPITRTLSKVDVQRRAEDLARGLGDLFGGAPLKVEIAWKTAAAPGLADNGDGLAVISAALEEAAAGIRSAASDDAARRDLARRLKRVRVGESSRAGVSLSGDTLSIGVAPTAGFAGRASAWEVRRVLLP